MNYIAEINNFNDWLLENPMNSAEQALWYKLMAYANRLGWKSEFSMTNSRLCEDLRITRQYLDKCRNTLVNKGLITYKKGNGNQCGVYHLISLSVDTPVDTPVDTVVDTVVDTTVAHQLTQQCLPSLPLNKLNKTKQDQTKLNSMARTFSKPTVDEIKEYCRSRKNSVNADKFFDYYESNGWKVGKNSMKDWKACVRTWENNNYGDHKSSGNPFADLLRKESGYDQNRNYSDFDVTESGVSNDVQGLFRQI